jgi:hypothetical protein
LSRTAAINQEAQDLADRRGCSHNRSAAAHRWLAGHHRRCHQRRQRGFERDFSFPEPENSSPSPESSAESSDELDDDTGGRVKIGETFTYEDGLKVSVVSAKKDTAGQDPVEGSPGDPTAIITIKITNGTGKKFGAGDVWVDVSYGEYGDSAWDLYDSNGFVGTISSGRSKMAKYEFLVEDKKGLNDLAIEVTPSWDYDSVIFAGAAK